jgi:hypothetical protein
MHRHIEIAVSPEHTDPLLDRLGKIEAVIALSVSRGASLKPPGDLVGIYSLNRGADDVMRSVAELSEHTRVVASTSDVASITDKKQQEAIEDDTDDELWEEVETGLRQTTHITPNYLGLMALGGVIAAAAFMMHDIGQAISFVSASIIAPGFEPIAKLPMGVVLKSSAVAKRAFWSFLAGYAVLFATAGATFGVLYAAGLVNPVEVAASPGLNSIMANGVGQNIISICGALAGIIMLTSHREEVIAGAIMALEMIPACAVAAAGMVSFHGDLFWMGAVRFGIDVVFVLGTAAAFFWLKQRLVHKRRAMI